MQENQKRLARIFILFQNLNTSLSNGNPSSWEMFLNETRHDFIELFYFSVICSSCSRKFEEKVNINRKRVNTEVQLIQYCSERIVNDVKWTCINRKEACVETFHLRKSIQKFRKSQFDIPRWSISWNWNLTLSTNSKKCSEIFSTGQWSTMMVPQLETFWPVLDVIIVLLLNLL